MKLPADDVRAKAYRKVPEELGNNYSIRPLSNSDFAAAKEALSKLAEIEIADAFVWTQDQTYRGEDILSLMAGNKIPGKPPRTHDDDWREASHIMTEMGEVRVIFETGILHPSHIRHPLFRSAVTMILINLNDLLWKMKNAGQSVITTDERGETDLLDVVSAARNAACHITTRKTLVGPSEVKFFVSAGVGGGMRTQGRVLACAFADDVAIFFGENCLYLGRDLLTAYERLKAFYGENGIPKASTKA